MKIYTKTGDAGETGLFGGGRVSKADARVDAYGELDELNAFIGLARSAGLPADVDALCQTLQDQLFTVGATLATPKGTKASSFIPPIKPEWAEAMERAMDRYDEEVPKMTHFILPGGTPGASALHVARTVCRRAERRIVPLLQAGEIDAGVIVYVNRLSDLLFVLARLVNHRAGVQDVKWIPDTAATK